MYRKVNKPNPRLIYIQNPTSNVSSAILNTSSFQYAHKIHAFIHRNICASYVDEQGNKVTRILKSQGIQNFHICYTHKEPMQ